MSPENFVYWMNGFFELTNSTNLTPEQVKIIKDHLALVMNKTTPAYPPVNIPNITYPYYTSPLLYPTYPTIEGIKVTCTSGASGNSGNVI